MTLTNPLSLKLGLIMKISLFHTKNKASKKVDGTYEKASYRTLNPNE
jgi:hypothetical protein